MKQVLADIFNEIFQSGQYPKQWVIGMIKPLLKSGDKKNPSNYRGIALLNIVSILFSMTGLQSGLKCTISLMRASLASIGANEQ